VSFLRLTHKCSSIRVRTWVRHNRAPPQSLLGAATGAIPTPAMEPVDKTINVELNRPSSVRHSSRGSKTSSMRTRDATRGNSTSRSP
jgi:hypothetical protein